VPDHIPSLVGRCLCFIHEGMVSETGYKYKEVSMLGARIAPLFVFYASKAGNKWQSDSAISII
jgi:hypothetical protein